MSALNSKFNIVNDRVKYIKPLYDNLRTIGYTNLKFNILEDDIGSILKNTHISHLALFAGETNINQCFKNYNLSNK